MFLFISCKTPSIIATQAIQQGDAANNQNKYEVAIDNYKAYLEITPSLGVMRNQEREASVHRKISHAYAAKGKYTQALLYARLALKIDQKINDNVLNIIEDHRLVGLTHIYSGKYDSALISLKNALGLNEGMESSAKSIKKKSIADTYLSIAQLELTTGAFNESWGHISQARSIYRKDGNDMHGLMETDLLIGKLLLSQNMSDSAVFYISSSLSKAEELNYYKYRQLQSLGDARILEGELEKAVTLKQQALEEAKSSNIKPQIIWSNIQLGNIYEQLGDIKKAKYYFHRANKLQLETSSESSSLTPSLHLRFGDLQKAYDLFATQGATLGSHIAALKIAEIMLANDPKDSIEILVQEALGYFNENSVTEGQFKAELLLSIFYQKQEDYSKAMDYLLQAEKLNVMPDSKWKLWYNKAKILESQLNPEQAEDAFERAVKIIEDQRSNIKSQTFKWFYFDSKVEVYSSYISLLLSKSYTNEAKKKKAFELNESARSRTFHDMLMSKNISDRAGESGARIDQLIDNQIAVITHQIELNTLKSIDKSFLYEKLKSLENQKKEHQSNLSENAPSYATLKRYQPISIKKLRASINDGTALLEFWLGEKETIIWTISKNEFKYDVITAGRNIIEKEVIKVRNLIKHGNEQTIKESFSSTYSLLFAKVNRVFNEYENVGIIPHGALHFLPFQALYHQGKYLIERTNIFYSPSASVYYQSTVKAPVGNDNQFLGMALGDMRIGNFSPLPGTALELGQLAQFYNSALTAYKDQSTESFFKENTGKFDYIHLATHGVMNKYQPLRSHLLLAPSKYDDGKLTVDEIFDLNLNSKFVTLSACETGLGDLSTGDEIIGLSRAFIYSGASAVIVSLWKVDDISTALLMTKMHQFIKSGLPVAAALSRAQRDLITKNFEHSSTRSAVTIDWHDDLKNAITEGAEQYTSPYFWAPFIVIGNPGTN